MELAIGNIYLRVPNAPMAKDDVVVGHQHHFDHTTFVLQGAFEISLLSVKSVDAQARPLEADIDYTTTIQAGDEVPFHLILKGRYHIIRALEDGSRYACIYAHQYPQALSMGEQGQRVDPPLTKRDEDGTVWVRVNNNIVQTPCGWVEAYR